MSGLQGHLDLLATAGSAGRTILRRQSFAPPIHISKPHEDAGWLVVNLANPTPGLFAGDRVKMRVEVQGGARLLLTAPSANRLHTMAEGHAELTQEFRVADDGWLEVLPEYLIPQAGAHYRQRTRINVASTGVLLWTETLAPGRTARGEVFAFRELVFATDLFHESEHLVRERYRMTPESTASLRRRFPTAYYASMLCVGPKLRSQLDTLSSLADGQTATTCWIGVSRVSSEVWAIKVLAADSPTLRTTVANLRARLHQALGSVAGSLRRVTGDGANT